MAGQMSAAKWDNGTTYTRLHSGAGSALTYRNFQGHAYVPILRALSGAGENVKWRTFGGGSCRCWAE